MTESYQDVLAVGMAGAFDPSGMHALSHALLRCRSLRQLDLTGNSLCGCDVYGRGTPCATALAVLLRAARQCYGLAELVLGDNWLGAGPGDDQHDAQEITALRERLQLDEQHAGGHDASLLRRDSDVVAGCGRPNVSSCAAKGSAGECQDPAVVYCLKARPPHHFVCRQQCVF